MTDREDLNENAAPQDAAGIPLDSRAALSEAPTGPTEPDHAPVATDGQAREASPSAAGRAVTASARMDSAPDVQPPTDGRVYELIPAPFERIAFAAGAGPSTAAPASFGAIFRLRNIAAAAAAFAILAGIGAELLHERHRQAALLAQRTMETEALAQTVKTLKARLDTMEATKPRDDTAELRRSIGELKSGVASARDLNGALAQLAQRVDKLDHEQTAKVEKLGEKLDKDATTKAAELAARLDKLEKKSAAPAVASVQPPTPPIPPAASTPQVTPAVTALPKTLSPVSPETTGSIERPKPMIRNYAVLDADGESAMLASRNGPFEVRVGEVLPGAGRVERIERRGRSWTVVTNLGVIVAAD